MNPTNGKPKTREHKGVIQYNAFFSISYASPKVLLNIGFARGLNLVCDRVCEKSPTNRAL